MKRKKYFTIGVVASMYNIHPQTLRLYEREGLIKPARTKGNTRLYSEEDLKRLELILTLTRELGVNLAGVDIILRLKDQIEELQRQMEELLNYIKEELKRCYEGEELEKAIVSVSKVGKIVEVEEIIKKK